MIINILAGIGFVTVCFLLFLLTITVLEWLKERRMRKQHEDYMLNIFNMGLPAKKSHK